MLSLDELLGLIEKYKPNVNKDIIAKAYAYAMDKHSNQKRASGESYFSHPLHVAEILVNMRLDEATIVAALLHDTIEDTTATKTEISKLFGENIANLVDGLTKLKKLDLISEKAIQAENLRKLLLAITNDVRVLLVKLADRLHNMRTLNVMRKAKRYRISLETLEIYAPLASRMGMQDIKEELENTSFKYINEEAYNAIQARLSQTLEQNKHLLTRIGSKIESLLAASQVSATIKRRMKEPYAIFHKMEIKGLKFEELTDIFAFRIIVENTLDCYKVLGILHSKWAMVPGRFKDYISTPKQNGYQSIHTTIVGPNGQRIEIQIRTYNMEEIAEYGVAAYSSYKEGEAFKELCVDNSARVSAWLRRTLDLLAEGDSPEEFLEHTKLELYQDQVLCFTPKGQLISLPQGATVLDFAYAVHTNIGNCCVGSKVNGLLTSIFTELKNGDEVEIMCDNSAKPDITYEKFVKTGRARVAIRKATKAEVYKKYCTIGRTKLEDYFALYGKAFDIKVLDNIYEQFSYKNVDSLLASIGRNELSEADIFKAIYPNIDEKKGKTLSFSLRNIKPLLRKRAAYLSGKNYPLYGIEGKINVNFSPKGIVPGDAIIGVLDNDKKNILIYPTKAKLPKHKKKQLVDIMWHDKLPVERYRAHIYLLVQNQVGVINKISSVLTTNDVSIFDVLVRSYVLGFCKMEIVVDVWNLKQLNFVIALIRELNIVSRAYRLYN